MDSVLLIKVLVYLYFLNSIIIFIYLSFCTKKSFIKINIESSCQEIWIIIGVLEINRFASLLKSFRTYINTVISIRSERTMVQIC